MQMMDVSRVMIGMLWQYHPCVHLNTADNGSEFCEHEQTADVLINNVSNQ